MAEMDKPAGPRDTGQGAERAPRRGRRRAWPGPWVRGALAIFLLLILALRVMVWIEVPWALALRDTATNNVLTLSLLLASVVTLIVWFCLFSSYAAAARYTVLGACCGAPALFFVLFEADGVDGYMNLGWRFRFAPRPDERMPAVAEEAPRQAGIDLRTESAADFPEFLGPRRRCAVQGIELETDWQAFPPREVWRRRIGAGWSAFAARNGYAVTMEQRGPRELVTCYDIVDGKLVWGHGHDARYETELGGIGPRATPTLTGGKVYALGALGWLVCLEGASGNPIWTRDVLKDVNMPPADNAARMLYGRSNSPLVVDGLVVVGGGGPLDGTAHALIAYDAKTGQPRWKSGAGYPSYSSPTVATLCGVRQILSLDEKHVRGYAIENGRVLWEYSFSESATSDRGPNVAQPVALPGDRVLVSNGYFDGGMVIELHRDADGAFRPSFVWQEPGEVKTKFTNVTIFGDHIYCLSDGIFQCVRWEDGQRMWKRGRYGHGQILRVGGSILVQNEFEKLTLVAADPARHVELSEIDMLAGKTWNNLCLYGDKLLIRNDREAVCFRLALKTADNDKSPAGAATDAP